MPSRSCSRLKTPDPFRGASTLWRMGWWSAFWKSVGSVLGGFTNWWNTLNIGNLSEALAAAGSLAVVLTTLALTRHENRRHRRSELEARLDHIEARRRERYERIEAVTLVLDDPDESGWVDLAVYNKSARPISRAYLVQSSPDLDLADVPKDRLLSAEPAFWVGVVAAGETFEGAFKEQEAGVSVDDGVAMMFDDVDGSTWWVHADGGYQLALDLSFYSSAEVRGLKQELESLDTRRVRFQRWLERRATNRRARRALSDLRSTGYLPPDWTTSDLTPRVIPDGPGRVTPQPSSPAPDPSDPPSGLPDPSAAS